MGDNKISHSLMMMLTVVVQASSMGGVFVPSWGINKNKEEDYLHLHFFLVAS